MKPLQTSNRKGFTLIELLTVIAVIGILAAILIPTVGRVRESAKKTQSRAQFSQWITAIETFRTEYGHWPDFNSDPGDWEATPLNSDDNLVVRVNQRPQVRRNFIEYLYGRHANGERFDANDFVYREHPNRRRINFYDFTENDFRFTGSDRTISKDASNIKIVDSFDNIDILIVMDGDQNGVITLRDADEYAVAPPDPSDPENPDDSLRTAPYQEARDIRASVIVYSAGSGGRTTDEVRDNIVRSW